MKGIKLLLTVLVSVIGGSYQGICDFNPFEQRKIVIHQFENRGGPRYDYVKESIEDSVYSYALSVPFVSLTDEEIVALQNLSILDRYKDLFEEAGGTIPYRMEPSVIRGEFLPEELPISIRGYYNVHSEEDVSLSISAYNSLTQKVFTEYETKIDLFTILNRPEDYLIPFFKRFLRYKTYRVSISAFPSDSLLFIDNRLIGIGMSRELLLSPGYHRISVKREGYRSFTDLIYIAKDGYESHIVLKKEKKEKPVFYTATPPRTRVYSGERFEGETPLSVSISAQDRTVTFVKEGYIQKTVLTQEVLEGADKYQVQLITEEDKEKLLNEAELHRKSSETLYYTGIGVLGLSIILGIERTANLQKADLYREVDPARHTEALTTSSILNYLTVASSILTAGIFIFSFIEMLRYFNLYNYHESMPSEDLLKKKVRF